MSLFLLSKYLELGLLGGMTCVLNIVCHVILTSCHSWKVLLLAPL